MSHEVRLKGARTMKNVILPVALLLVAPLVFAQKSPVQHTTLHGWYIGESFSDFANNAAIAGKNLCVLDTADIKKNADSYESTGLMGKDAALAQATEDAESAQTLCQQSVNNAETGADSTVSSSMFPDYQIEFIDTKISTILVAFDSYEEAEAAAEEKYGKPTGTGFDGTVDSTDSSASSIGHYSMWIRPDGTVLEAYENIVSDDDGTRVNGVVTLMAAAKPEAAPTL
jgi:hypothetical protein